MPRRLLAFLLLIGLAIPALTGTPVMAMTGGAEAHCAGQVDDGGAKHHKDAAPSARHDCMGCVAPFLDPAAPPSATALQPLAPVEALTVRLRSPEVLPDPPPPRV